MIHRHSSNGLDWIFSSYSSNTRHKWVCAYVSQGVVCVRTRMSLVGMRRCVCESNTPLENSVYQNTIFTPSCYSENGLARWCILIVAVSQENFIVRNITGRSFHDFFPLPCPLASSILVEFPPSNDYERPQAAKHANDFTSCGCHFLSSSQAAHTCIACSGQDLEVLFGIVCCLCSGRGVHWDSLGWHWSCCTQWQ